MNDGAVSVRENHPVADLFPMMDTSALNALAADIEANGLREAIVLHEDKVLDGRSRLAACQLAGVEPRFEQYVPAGSLTAYVLSKNLHRRHMTPSQLALVAANARPLFEEEARARMLAGVSPDPAVRKQQGSCDAPIGGSKPSTRSSAEAASLVGVSESMVDKAVRIRREAPERIPEIERGERTVSEVYRGLRPPRGTPRREMVEKAALGRMLRVFESADNVSELAARMYLPGVRDKDRDWEIVTSAATPAFLADMEAKARRSARRLMEAAALLHKLASERPV